MGKRWEEQTDTFTVEDEAGNIYHVVKYTKFEDTSSFGAPNDVGELRSRYETDGYTVTHVGKNEFELENLLSREKIRAIREP